MLSSTKIFRSACASRETIISAVSNNAECILCWALVTQWIQEESRHCMQYLRSV